MTIKNNTRKKVRRFLQEMDETAKLKSPIISNEEDFLELLLSRNIDEINRSLSLIMIKIISSCQSLCRIKNNDVYIVFYPKGSGELQYMLGADIISPQIEIPTVNQFHEAYHWYKMMSSVGTKFYKSIDDLVRLRVDQSLKALRYLEDISKCEISPWEYIFLTNDGKEIHLELIRSAQKDFSEIRESLKFLNENNAPFFLQEEDKQNLQKIGVIIRQLTKNVNY